MIFHGGKEWVVYNDNDELVANHFENYPQVYAYYMKIPQSRRGFYYVSFQQFVETRDRRQMRMRRPEPTLLPPPATYLDK